ncbi:MAG: UDP-3-O-(3-hydroxymyristoyl)glucosamine N-acyltransferase [Chitinispirillales bacterium]|nr:UDP-3-O-(3-hydroxymyristoyl)glucosamine N-acyltransferase [Chitinispirillales bacterium]
MKLSVIAVKIGSTVPEDKGDMEIEGISSPKAAMAGDITFLSDPKYKEQIDSSAASAVIVKKGVAFTGKICLEVDDPYLGYARTAQLFEDVSPLFRQGVHRNAFVDPAAVIDASASAGPFTVIGSNVHIAANVRIGANCVIERDSRIGEGSRIDSGAIIRWGTLIGSNVVIQSGAVIGSDGFGNARAGAEFVRIPCFGIVIIEDNADIGACTTIDRGNFEPTVIGKGVKLDNLIHVAHNVEIGENTAIAAQTGISGSTHIGKRVIIAGQAGFVGHIEIGDDAFIGAKSGVSKNVAPKSKITGYPARDFMTMRRIEASMSQVPELLKEVKRLKSELESLRNAASI